MSDIAELKQAKDGAALKELSESGNTEAGLAFADLVFAGKYAGNTKVHKSKKAAKEEAFEDAPRLVEAAADTGDRACLEAAATMHYLGVKTPGNFGDRVLPASYKKAIVFYEALLKLEGSSNEQTAKYLFEMGQCLQFRLRIKQNKDPEAAKTFLDLWEQAWKLEAGLPSVQAGHSLSDWYWSNGNPERAVELAKAVCDAAPWAHLTLHQAYKSGIGVEKDEFLASNHYQHWNDATGKKKRGKK